MKSDLDELERGRAKSRFNQTVKGKLYYLIDRLFSVYCIYKLISTAINVVFQRNTSDPITNALSIMISHLDKHSHLEINIDRSFWSQQLSFWFAGIIVFSSVRGCLKLLTKILHIFTFKITFSQANILLSVSHMMGMYFLSSILMMQMSLPPEYRYLMSSSLQSIEFEFFKHWSDIIVVISSLVSFFIIYILHTTHDPKAMAVDFADMELLSVESGAGR
ncbi:Abscisic acid G-protein coupled receptor-like domain-containing protein [Mycotypha africana]|uniref:Abscisic acid G-protein coupled receptor-like domain-containing protein n=1 Tax=Mycotypha africana TaxID=64632 RepID=UPI0022FFCC4D|nr:Abscisic acid G-protein coupled receptor-like domain-containing protein [Mycotypha africana]KAI8984081.1 Abscisic acid G-protein coupled receptor-like domain-containing protein [Mycotypha africana]